ncbi:phage tail protein, partial [Vibrio parahaemolyticus]
MALGSIPNDIRVPLVYIEIDNSQALTGTPALAQKVLVIGQQLSGGSATPLTLSRITTSESQIDDLYGKGAMLSRTLKQFRKDNQFTDVYALGVADLAATAAKGEIAVTTSTVKAGVIYLLIAGESVQVTVKDTDDADSIATAIVAAVTENTDLPVTAALKAASTNIVEFT